MTPSQDDISDNGSESESVVEHSTGPWPGCTALVKINGAKNLSLKAQQYHVKVTIREAMGYLEERILFDNAFPSLQQRNVWNRAGMVRACDRIGNVSSRRVQRMYDCVASRIQGDAYYLKSISSLVCIHPSMH